MCDDKTIQTELDLGQLEIMEIGWKGPYSFPGFEEINGLPPLVGGHGVYLKTFRYGDGCILWEVGKTDQPFRDRQGQHRTNYRSVNSESSMPIWRSAALTL
jgi:hypothetical protein